MLETVQGGVAQGECESESQDLRELWDCNRSTAASTDSSGSKRFLLKDSNDTVLRHLFSLFLDLHKRSHDVDAVTPEPSRQASSSPRKFRAGASNRTGSTNETGTEFGAPVASDPSVEDVAVLVSVLLTTLLVFLCFLVLLAVKCCAELCCIDLLYCMSYRCRKSPDQVVVLQVVPNARSLERLLHHNARSEQ
ncbi:hypothetical protein IscW_ISCW000789 [Ixodes scapularis]|uniref:Uncharacterized protein n=1 Tax=Ixodes scapularis TaxID=6945 RepID=B7P4N3_IXOSC|nr:hypothetical protein IscW_ISCW000789 [Ixodes scapularis]|eukprot:XP_002406291.1 hypothetical protein IscW_ISCW000789 [Ixodes scapularis]